MEVDPIGIKWDKPRTYFNTSRALNETALIKWSSKYDLFDANLEHFLPKSEIPTKPEYDTLRGAQLN